MKSAEDLHVFADLWRLSWTIPLEQQATILHERLNKTVYRNGGSPLYTLCAIEMLLRHGNAGLHQEIMRPEKLQTLANYFLPGSQPAKIEYLQPLARHIKVSPHLSLH